MHLTTALDELTEADLLAHADEVSRTQRECEAQVLRIAVQQAIINNPDTLDPVISALPGPRYPASTQGTSTAVSGPSASEGWALPTSRSSPLPRSAPAWGSRRVRPAR